MRWTRAPTVEREAILVYMKKEKNYILCKISEMTIHAKRATLLSVALLLPSARRSPALAHGEALKKTA